MRWAGVGACVILADACRQAGSLVDPILPDAGKPTYGARWPPPREGYANPIPGENQQRGDPSWNRGFSNPWAAQIEAYANRVSAKAGDTVKLMVRSDRGCQMSWTLYRLGWYGGDGARALTSGTAQAGSQPACPKDAGTGLVRCSWSPTFSVTVPQDAVSGLHLIRIVREDKIGILIPLVVKDDRPADLVMNSAVLTAQAYNNWGGTGLYDPLAGTPQQTGRFRDSPINRPEEELVGTMYESWMLFGQAWTVLDPGHAMYEGTGLRQGDSIPQLVGYEYDRTFELDTPSPVEVVARSPLVDAEGKPGYAEATVYTAPSGALVFGAGSIYWPRGLDGPLRDARVERMTANLLKLGLQLPIPSVLLSVSGPASPPPAAQWASSVRTLVGGMSGPAGLAQMPDGTFVIADARANRIWQTNGSTVWPLAGDGHPSGD